MPRFRVVLYRKRYYAAWREHGQIRRKTLATDDYHTATEALEILIEGIERANRPSPVTVEYIWNGYRETLIGKPSWDTMGYEARAILPYFNALSAAEDIEESNCRDYRNSRKAAGRKDGTIWTELGRLRSALKWAERKNLIAKAPTIYRPAMSPPRDLRLTREQASKLLSCCITPHMRLCVILAMTTGARIGALLSLKWDRVNFDRSIIDLNDPRLPKTKKGRAIVPMNATARAALSEARTGATSPFVVEWAGKPVKSVKRGLQAAGRRSGLPWVTAHVFRHSVASWQAEAGVGMDKIAAFLGHSDSRITARVYAKFSPDYLRDAAAALEIETIMDVNGKVSK